MPEESELPLHAREGETRDILSRVDSVSVAKVRVAPKERPSPFSRRLVSEDDAPQQVPEPKPARRDPTPEGAGSAAMMDVIGEIFRHNAEVMRTSRIPLRDIVPARGEAAPPAPRPPQEVTLNIASIDLPPLDVPMPKPPAPPKAFRATTLAEYLRARNEGRR